MTDSSALARHPLLTEAAGEVLDTALRGDGVQLRAWRRTRIHPRGSSLSVRFDVDVDGADRPTIDVVAHTSQRPVPTGSAVVRVGHRDIHVWRVPHDPYMPGLGPALAPRRLRQLLDRIGADRGEVTPVLRAYRPTRRAVVGLNLATEGSDGAAASSTVLYVKVMGGRDPDRVAIRATRLADVHRALAGTLPVPRVVGTAIRQGIVALTAMPGPTLRTALVLGHELPPAGEIAELSQRLATTRVDSHADPVGYADVRRHIDVLASAQPDLRPLLEEVAAFAATAGGPAGTVHGDLHDGQMLILDGAISGLLDVDGVGPGRLAQDAGRLVAYLGSARDVDRADPDRVDGYVASVVEAYDAIGVPRRDLAAGAAGAWIGLATSPFRSRPHDWEDRVRERVERGLAWARS